MRETRQQRKERTKARDSRVIRRFVLVAALSIVATVPLGILLEPYLPSVLSQEMPRPDVPRLIPFTPPLEGGREGDNREATPIPSLDGIITRLPADKRVVALTFDDGPDPLFTPRLLKTLRDEGIKATFFVIGNRARAHPELVRRMISEGHEVGNHTMSHPRLTQVPKEMVRYEIVEAQRVLEETLGGTPSLFRPPYGRIDQTTMHMASDAGLKIVMWSVDSRDWEGISAKEIIGNVLPNVEPGSIIIMHCAGGVVEGFYQTLEALPGIVTGLKKMGYQMVTVGELLGR